MDSGSTLLSVIALRLSRRYFTQLKPGTFFPLLSHNTHVKELWHNDLYFKFIRFENIVDEDGIYWVLNRRLNGQFMTW